MRLNFLLAGACTRLAPAAGPGVKLKRRGCQPRTFDSGSRANSTAHQVEDAGVGGRVVLTARATGGELTTSDESSEVGWVPRVELGGYSMDRSMRLRIGHYLEGRATPYLGLGHLVCCLICWRQLQRSC